VWIGQERKKESQRKRQGAKKFVFHYVSFSSVTGYSGCKNMQTSVIFPSRIVLEDLLWFSFNRRVVNDRISPKTSAFTSLRPEMFSK